MNAFFHSGDMGDVIACLPSVLALGGGRVVIGPHDFNLPGGMIRQSMKGPRFEALRPLLDAQPYIPNVEWQDKPSGINFDFCGFRHDGRHAENLADWQARHMNARISLDPWLTVPAKPHGRVVVARSQRYHAGGFPWRDLLDRYPNPIFVGLAAEHYAFQAEFGPVEYQPTIDLLALAKVIAGCRLFIGNQSCPMWIALGLGVPIIQETCPSCPNTIIQRPNCRYTLDLGDLTRLCHELQPQGCA